MTNFTVTGSLSTVTDMANGTVLSRGHDAVIARQHRMCFHARPAVTYCKTFSLARTLLG
jgi:hypothetical protein